MSGTQIEILPDAETLAERGSAHIAEQALKAISARKRFTIALAGGSTPQGTYQRLTAPPYSHEIPWAQVHIFWGDERSVPPEHADSNFRMAKEIWLDRVPLTSENIHRMRGELAPDVAAKEYAKVLENEFGESPPRFDHILLGLGEDGHTASLFPFSPALDVMDRDVTENNIEGLDAWRLTLTYRVINNARQVSFLVSGGGKAEVLQKVIEGNGEQVAQYPAAGVRPSNGDLLWLVDSAAALKLNSNKR